MTHYPSHSVLALYIFILHQVTFMWNADGFQRKNTQHMNVNCSVQDSKQTCTQILLAYAIGTVAYLISNSASFFFSSISNIAYVSCPDCCSFYCQVLDLVGDYVSCKCND